MAIAHMLQQYLANQGADYDLVPHTPTTTSLRTASASHIPSDWLAKAVLMRDGDGYLLAVLPASHHVQLSDLSAQLERPVAFATEDEAERLFPDCARGALPPLGGAYGVDVVVDDSLSEQPEIYLEAGDHETLVHMKPSQFDRLTAQARHGRFSVRE